MSVSMSQDGPLRICFVCSGNICRSPMAEAVFREFAAQAALDDVEVDSAGTGDWHVGERADLRTLRVLAAAGYDASDHRARQFEPLWFPRREFVIALDRGHARTLRSWAPDDEQRVKVRLLRSFDPAIGPDAPGHALDVADPYYDGEPAFRDVLGQIESAAKGLLDHIRRLREGTVAVD